MKKRTMYYMLFVLACTLTVVAAVVGSDNTNSVGFGFLIACYVVASSVFIWLPIGFTNSRALLISGICLIAVGIISYLIADTLSGHDPRSTVPTRFEFDTYKQFFLLLAAAVGANYVAHSSLEIRNVKKRSRSRGTTKQGNRRRK